MRLNITKRCVKKGWLVFSILSFTLFIAFIINLLSGSVEIPASDVVSILCGDEARREVWSTIVLESRLPQACTALLVGAAISVAGLMLQTLFGNPLAGPEVLGINSGAGLGVAVVMLLSHGLLAVGDFGVSGYLAVLTGAFTGAMLIITIVLLLSSILRNKLFLLIAGVAISYLASSVIAVINYVATAEGVHSYLIWGMGSFSAVSLDLLPLFSILLLQLLFFAILMIKPLNALLLGDMYAKNLGIHVSGARIIILCLTGLITATITAFCGPVAFLGLAVPHLARLSIGSNDHRLLLPSTMLVGGIVALICNALTYLPGESGLLPLGAITPLVGAPVIIYVVLRDRSL